jgi:hypothetical protein
MIIEGLACDIVVTGIVFEVVTKLIRLTRFCFVKFKNDGCALVLPVGVVAGLVVLVLTVVFTMFSFFGGTSCGCCCCVVFVVVAVVSGI